MSMLSGTYCQALFFEIVCNVAAMHIFSLLAPQALVLRPPQAGKRMSAEVLTLPQTVVLAEEGWTPSSLSVWKILGPIGGSWDVRARCPLPVLPGHSVPLNQGKFPACPADSAQLFSYDNWAVGCLHLRRCCLLWRRWGAALEAGDAALAGKRLLSLRFLYVLTRDIKAEGQDICLPPPVRLYPHGIP